ncbi:alpha/beta fold hydrolase [Fundicoccus culcitae]|uniref:Alpha/beta hydrolase n=1 Tax=Fundicoccus culcitae TaxID=2969821 RepID=A0ABY5P2X8_9LACT|nr:alpha/beta fold hydrolase [Fundicoccus culcitae]UUX33082.1 alpha/beta hydrolase [Fundicoccus culcitae]
MAYFSHQGVNLYYEIKGNPHSDKVVAFFNGVMANTNSWNLVIDIFRKLDFKILCHDFRGQLQSDKPDGPYTFDLHAEDAKALFDYLEMDQVHIVGTSYGSEVGMRFAMLYPETVASLAVIDGVSELDEVLKSFIYNWECLLELEDGEKFFKAMAPSIYGNRFMEENADMLEERAQALKKVDPSYFRGQKILYETFKNDVTMTDRLHTIQAPTLVVCGQDDLLKRPKFSQIIADHIPHSEYYLLPDCGHVAIFEKPEELKTLLAGFIIKNL